MLRVKGNGTNNPSHLCQQHALYNAAQLLIWGDKQKHQLRVGWLSDTPDKHSYPDRWLNIANNELNLFFFFFFFKRDNGSVCFGSSGLHWLVLLKSERQHKIIIIIIINIQCVPSVCVCEYAVCSVRVTLVSQNLACVFGVCLGPRLWVSLRVWAPSRVVPVVFLHHALDVEQFVPQPATLFLLGPVVWRLRSRGKTM